MGDTNGTDVDDIISTGNVDSIGDVDNNVDGINVFAKACFNIFNIVNIDIDNINSTSKKVSNNKNNSNAG